jgi:hypothetical protein
VATSVLPSLYFTLELLHIPFSFSILHPPTSH